MDHMPMVYEVNADTLDMYAQNLLSKTLDEKEERFGAYKEKILSLHSQFIKIGM